MPYTAISLLRSGRRWGSRTDLSSPLWPLMGHKTAHGSRVASHGSILPLSPAHHIDVLSGFSKKDILSGSPSSLMLFIHRFSHLYVQCPPGLRLLCIPLEVSSFLSDLAFPKIYSMLNSPWVYQ
ncbi:hypothetical protein BRADI_2g14835v3 [Brachypodium distachyon]|uniref:Uncharacterized protein n=1 Tax=Brachypodium distachyon TaxID=15368 RepID=A0A2K2D8M4_BRADI|nr:hypothetical protein BRADI_2g14835v3 [Brachypodium distachyon]PNT70632.1 hypothetical protein BRADI_2g14835v3 [Brachypodium distachyon]